MDQGVLVGEVLNLQSEPWQFWGILGREVHQHFCPWNLEVPEAVGWESLIFLRSGWHTMFNVYCLQEPEVVYSMQLEDGVLESWVFRFGKCDLFLLRPVLGPLRTPGCSQKVWPWLLLEKKVLFLFLFFVPFPWKPQAEINSTVQDKTQG